MKTLRLTIALVALLSLAPAALAKEPVTVFITGDSTAAPKLETKRPETGWGEHLQKHFDERKVRVDNRAANGRSTRTFISENRWQAVLDKLKAGDYVLIQFGHNDQAKDKGERYTPPADFHANLTRFVREVRAKRATPVLLTPVMRRRFDKQGQFYDVHGEYPDITRRVASEQKAALIDMHRASEKVLVKYGPEESRKLFLQLKAGEHANYPQGVDDNTHFSPAGADIMASLAVEGIREQRLGLAKFLKKADAAKR
ncbi:MAG TPA: rhamnogalacturonan acetylesterase [Pyrinomonadaceae bacterium]|nr:rhamnogalacturonan acetylesterase [Pyrinomonadaceae bacterium]